MDCSPSPVHIALLYNNYLLSSNDRQNLSLYIGLIVKNCFQYTDTTANDGDTDTREGVVTSSFNGE